MRNIVCRGIVLHEKSGYVCWNSFKSCWYLGPRRLSEIFMDLLREPHLDYRRAKEAFPNARPIYEVDKESEQ